MSRLRSLLDPRSVAVVGASQNPSFVSSILKNLGSYGFEGPVVAVNPRYDRIGKAPCYPSVADIPHPVDLVVVGIAHRYIPELLDQCERIGVGALEILSSGFAETGKAGARRQAELSAWAKRTGIPVGGPNCLGLMNAHSGMVALPTAFERMIPGAVGAILQSGMMAPSVLVPLIAREIGLTIAVTTGNEADVEAADYLEYLVEHDETRVIACFTEQLKSPQRFIASCELAAERQKPIVMLKIGRSEAGQRAALAHTGSLVGADGAIDALLRKLGVTRVSSVDELLEAVAVFHARKLPRGRGVGAVIVSGGAAGLLADLAPETGVEFPPLPERTVAALKETVPEYGSVGNPLDITGQGVFETQILDRSLDLLAESGVLDVVVYCRGFPARLDRQTPVGRSLERAVEQHPDVQFLIMALAGGHLHANSYADVEVVEPLLQLDGVPFLQGADYGLRAIAALIRYAEFHRARAAERRGPRLAPPEAAEQAIRLIRASGGRPLTERESKQVLGLYGIPTTRDLLATTAEEAVAAAERIGYPVALKVESPDLPHKTEAGAVLLGVTDAEAVARGFEQILTAARRASPRADLRGVVVQEMVPPGVEMILGMSRDPQLGPVIACGLGGVLVEVLQDVQLLLPPLAEREVCAALRRLRGYSLLAGARGRAEADVRSLTGALLRFGELCQDLGQFVAEVDVNPLVVLEAARGVCAVDCLIIPAGRVHWTRGVHRG